MESPLLRCVQAKRAVIYDAIVACNTDISSPLGGLFYVIEPLSFGQQGKLVTESVLRRHLPVLRCCTIDLARNGNQGMQSMPSLLAKEA